MGGYRGGMEVGMMGYRDEEIERKHRDDVMRGSNERDAGGWGDSFFSALAEGEVREAMWYDGLAKRSHGQQIHRWRNRSRGGIRTWNLGGTCEGTYVRDDGRGSKTVCASLHRSPSS